MKTLTKNALWVTIVAAIGGQVLAQPASPSTPPPEKSVPMSAEAVQREADALHAQVRSQLQHVQHLQAKARKEKDIIKLSCVNDKFIKLKAEANIFDRTHRELIDQLDSDSQRNALYLRTAESAGEVRKVREEADGCIGEPQLNEGADSTVTSPTLLDDPTRGLPFDIDVEPPAYASPYI